MTENFAETAQNLQILYPVYPVYRRIFCKNGQSPAFCGIYACISRLCMDNLQMNYREYLAKIGAKGGKKSKRRLTKKQAREMANKRWKKEGK